VTLGRRKPATTDVEDDGKRSQEAVAAESWHNYLQRNKSIVVDLFQGQLRSTLTCSRCNTKRVKFDPFQYLSLPLPPTRGAAGQTTTVAEALDLFCEEEVLDGPEAWYCPTCKSHERATKKLDLWKLPPVLILHLKRFSYTDYGAASKLDTPVHFPLCDLDLSAHVKSVQRDRPLFDCYAVACHHGGFGSGHYTSLARNRHDDRWYEFDDSHVSPVPDPAAIPGTPRAYVLFYNRVVIEEGSGGAHNHGVGAAAHPLVRRQSVSMPHLWPHYNPGSTDSEVNLVLRTVSEHGTAHDRISLAPIRED